MEPLQKQGFKNLPTIACKDGNWRRACQVWFRNSSPFGRTAFALLSLKTLKPDSWSYNKLVVFVLDNYDSFTYNLVQYLGELGAQVEVRRNNEVTVGEIEAMHPERILLSPGPCTPQEAGISIELIRHFAGKGNVPLLGVCLGHQAIGAASGGQVV